MTRSPSYLTDDYFVTKMHFTEDTSRLEERKHGRKHGSKRFWLDVFHFGLFFLAIRSS